VEEFAKKRAGELAATILLAADADNTNYLATSVSLRQETADVYLKIQLEDAQMKPAAKEFADRLAHDVADFAKAALTRSHDQALQPLAEARVQAAQRLADAQGLVDQLRNQIRDVAHRADVSVKNINDAVTRLEEERQK